MILGSREPLARCGQKEVSDHAGIRAHRIRRRGGECRGEWGRKLQLKDTEVISVDAVTGPYDVIALLESEDLDTLGQAITDGIQRVDGVQRTNTCLVVKLG